MGKYRFLPKILLHWLEVWSHFIRWFPKGSVFAWAFFSIMRYFDMKMFSSNTFMKFIFWIFVLNCYSFVSAIFFHATMADFYKKGQPRPLFVYFQAFQLKFMWKMSIQYLAPGFKLKSFWLWVSSLNHQTRAPAQLAPF